MHNNRTTDNDKEHLPLDTQDWEIAFEAYEGNPDAVLGFNLMVLLTCLAVKPIQIQNAIEGVNGQSKLCSRTRNSMKWLAICFSG